MQPGSPFSSLSWAVGGAAALPGSPAAPGMCSRPIELDFMVMPRACQTEGPCVRTGCAVQQSKWDAAGGRLLECVKNDGGHTVS